MYTIYYFYELRLVSDISCELFYILLSFATHLHVTWHTRLLTNRIKHLLWIGLAGDVNSDWLTIGPQD